MALVAVIVVAIGIVLVARPAGSPTGSERLVAAGAHYAVTVVLDEASTGVVGVDILVEPATANAVWLSGLMLDMGHATPEIPAQQLPSGRFRANGELFFMAGVWALAVRVQGAAGTETIFVNVLVES